MRIKAKDFGKDHWSTLAYIETCCVDGKGKVNVLRMRCDPERHPAFAHRGSPIEGTPLRNEYPTRLRENVEIFGHDDWDCVDDMVADGILEWGGTGIDPVFRLTTKGWALAGLARRHRAEGKGYATFRPPDII